MHARFPGAYVLILRGTAGRFTSEDLEIDFTAATLAGLRLVVDLDALEYGGKHLLYLLIDARLTSGIKLVGPLSPSLKRRFDTAGVTTRFTLTSALAA
ncbi:hypothetical protein [Streptomyces sp. NPDC086147]|uniref:hypothetical protein n=1 Tax=Streptomyces sp. NPDC086147 TaxID=3155295 RepID=UPI003450277B